jgi:AcrR family transcriptional regulator
MPDGTRQRLIACAVTVLTAEGVDAVTVRRVAREAGISHGAPLRHFPSRAALLAAVASTGFARLNARLDALAATDPRERLVSACRSFVDFMRTGPGMAALMDQYPDDAFFARFRSLITGLQATGWRDSTDPRLLAASLWAALRSPDALDVTLEVYLR